MSCGTIGVDLGGTKLLAGRLDAAGRVAARWHAPTRRDSADAVLAQLEAAIAALRTPEVRAVGISTLSLIDRRTSRLGFSGPVPIEGVSLGPLLAGRTGLAVAVENDANAAALAEARLGAAAGADSAVVIVVGTGIGAGIVLGGRLHTGARGVAGEVGRICIGVEHADGGPAYVRFEDVAAGTPLDARAREAALVEGSDVAEHVRAGGAADARGLLALAERGPGLAATLVARHAALLAAGVITCAELFDPDVIVLGGGVFAGGDFLLDRIRAIVARDILPPGNEVRIVRAALGAEAGMIGAALLAGDRLAGRAATEPTKECAT